jgi:hypothetical protein
MIRQLVGLTYRFRQPVARAQPQYPRAGGGQRNSVTDGYENGFRPVSGSQNGADRFTLVLQKGIVSPAVPGRFIPADQATLGASDRRNVK